MRRIVRTVAAGIVIILGLAFVSVAAFSSDIVTATLPDAPTTSSEGGEVAPLDPNVDNPVRKTSRGAAYIFATEFGKRGKHRVTVTIRGGVAFYTVLWRGNKKDEHGALTGGVFREARTLNGGFPLVLIAVNDGGHGARCTITIDGIEKDSRATSAKVPIVYCEA